MKRRYYRIHHYDLAQPMKRVKHHHIVWSQVLLLGLIAVLLVIGALAILKWIGLGKQKPQKEAESTALPAMTDIPRFTAEPDNTPEPQSTQLPDDDFAVSPIDSVLPEAAGFTYKIMYNGQEQAAYTVTPRISFGGAYTNAEGILTFAGDNTRSGFSYGSPRVTEESLTKLWSCPVGTLNTGDYSGSGTGWTGQPVIVKWSDEVKSVLGVDDKFKQDENFTEVIYPAMDGKIYFLDLYSGEQTRQPINVGVITRGSAALDPRGYPLLYTGQSVTGTEDGYTGAWVRVVDLIENKVIYKFGGKDPFSPRVWQAYDSSPLISADADTLIMPGENGVIYFVHLNTAFNAERGTVSVDPDPLLKYKYTVAEGYSPTDEDGLASYGFEGSCACYGHYLYVADNGGRLQCIDMDTLTLKFVVDLGDECDASVVISEEADGVYLYTATQISLQSVASDNSGVSYHAKYNAATGELIWKKEQTAFAGSGNSTGGTIATPHVGRGEIDGLVVYSMTLAKVNVQSSTGSSSTVAGGLIVAYDKATGDEVWRHEQEYGYWSSPAVVYAENGKAYIIQADRDGIVTLHSAADGKPIATADIGSRIESTPAVFMGYIVVGTRGLGGSEQPAGVYCIRLA